MASRSAASAADALGEIGGGEAVHGLALGRVRPAFGQGDMLADRGQIPCLALLERPLPEPPWAAILTSSDMWLICGQQFFRAAGYVFYSTWFPTFLIATRGVSTAGAGALASLPLLAVASPVAPQNRASRSPWYRRRKPCHRPDPGGTARRRD